MRKDIIKESLYKSLNNLIKESSLTRIEKYVNNYEIAIITAWRTKYKDFTDNTFIPANIKKNGRNMSVGGSKSSGDTFTTTDKKYYNRELKGELLRLNYGVTNVRGSYLEQGSNEVQEESFFVVNLHDDPNFKETIFKLSEWYNQDSFLYSPKGTTESFLIGTNNDEFIGYGNEKPNGNFLKNVMSQFMSRIGSHGFSFTKGEDVTDMAEPEKSKKFYDYHNNYKNDEPLDFPTRKKIRKDVAEIIRKAIGIKLFEDYTPKERYSIALIADEPLKQMKLRK